MMGDADGLSRILREVRANGDYDRLLDAIPYTRMLGLRVEMRDGELLTCMAGREALVGNPMLPALHGGTIGALLESAAILRLLSEDDVLGVPKVITLSVDYLRSARVVDTWARASITRLGRRVANVQMRAFQDDDSRPVAMAHAHFLLRAGR